jgi:hypothetical protein
LSKIGWETERVSDLRPVLSSLSTGPRDLEGWKRRDIVEAERSRGGEEETKTVEAEGFERTLLSILPLAELS